MNPKLQSFLSNYFLVSQAQMTSQLPWFYPRGDLDQRFKPDRCGLGTRSQGKSWEKQEHLSNSPLSFLFKRKLYILTPLIGCLLPWVKSTPLHSHWLQEASSPSLHSSFLDVLSLAPLEVIRGKGTSRGISWPFLAKLEVESPSHINCPWPGNTLVSLLFLNDSCTVYKNLGW